MRNIYKIFFVTLMLLSKGVLGHNDAAPEFSDWLTKEFRPLALKNGISEDTLSRAFKDIQHVPQSIVLDGNQPEQKQTFIQYQEKRIPPRILTARKKSKQHQRILDTIQAKYGVPKEVILALWGLESNFGKHMGQFIIVHTLATLAFEGRRREFFTNELVEALKILQDQSMEPHHLKGSWAGALGQCQFMPSTFNAHAVDATQKGYKDIWNSTDDVFASIANYLVNSGWRAEEPWGVEVILPPGFNKKLATLSVQRPKHYWVQLGIKPVKVNTPIPELTGSLIVPDNQKKAFLVYNNFRVILKWNRSICFALTVCQFADQIRSYK
jgi:membrane-bound lytic murein transglycosylase B